MALQRFKFFILSAVTVVLFLNGCISSELRLPASVSEVYSNAEMKQSLILAAQNKILFNLPPETLIEAEKTEIDNRCRHFEQPFWAEKLSVYLNIFRSRPDLLSKIHIIEIKKGDAAIATIQKDMDDVAVLKIQYVKTESTGKVIRSTNLPCQGTLAEFIGREITKTQFEFPTVANVRQLLETVPERKDSTRFAFSPDFLTYLAERGALFKFSHELSFEKLPNGQYVMAQMLNQYGQEVKSIGRNPKDKSHLNLWLKKINQNSKQAELIQFFAVENDDQLRTGIKIQGEKEINKAYYDVPDITYLFTSYHVETEDLSLTSLNTLDQCLQKMTSEMGSQFFRTPASNAEKNSYLNPGYACSER
jgi:hypothetical protein